MPPYGGKSNHPTLQPSQHPTPLYWRRAGKLVEGTEDASVGEWFRACGMGTDEREALLLQSVDIPPKSTELKKVPRCSLEQHPNEPVSMVVGEIRAACVTRQAPFACFGRLALLLQSSFPPGLASHQPQTPTTLKSVQVHQFSNLLRSMP